MNAGSWVILGTEKDSDQTSYEVFAEGFATREEAEMEASSMKRRVPEYCFDVQHSSYLAAADEIRSQGK